MSLLEMRRKRRSRDLSLVFWPSWARQFGLPCIIVDEKGSELKDQYVLISDHNNVI